MTNGIPVCIECGGPTNDLNEDEQGDPCVACSERLLETLPGIFHAPWGQGAAAGAEVEEESAPESAQDELPSAGPSRRSPSTYDDPPEPA